MQETDTLIGSYAPDFELPGVDDQVHHLARYLENYQAVCVVFICNHCPYVKSYLERLKQLQADFSGQGVTLIGMNANDATQYPEDSFEKMKVFAAEHQLNFPYTRDVTQDVARCFKAEKTPEAFLLDQNSIVRYRGQIDDNPDAPADVKVPYLRNAIANLLKGEPIDPEVTETVGCSLKWRA